MDSINFDGMYWGQGYGCNTPGHGHLVGEGKETGVYGTYAVAAEEMRIFHRLREVRPGICLDLFICNEWSSPWWLMEVNGVHTVPGDTVAAGIPSPWLRDELITVRDMQVWDEHQRLNRQFPLWAEDLYGNQVRSDHLIDGIEVTGEAMSQRWEDEYVMALAGRGAIDAYIVCCDLGVLDKTSSGLRFLGEVGNWVRRNQAIYRNSALIGGDPAREQVYGYAHGDRNGRCLVALRNPAIGSQQFELHLGPELRIGRQGPYQVTMLYPYHYTWPDVPEGKPLSITLADFEVALLDVRSPGRRLRGVPAGRWATLPIGPSGTSSQDSGLIAAAGPDEEPQQPSVDLKFPDLARSEITGRLTIPPGEQAQLQVSVSPPTGTQSLSAQAWIDNMSVQPAVHFRDRGTSQDAWVLVDIPPGNHDLRLLLSCGSPALIAAWLQYRVERPFHPTKTSAPRGLFPALEPAEIRRTMPALTLTAISHDGPLPRGTVWLGDERSRCIRAETGWGRVGWNQSCWPQQPALQIGEHTYVRGLGDHAPGRIDFVLDGSPRILKAEVGIQPIPLAMRPPEWPRGSARFQVKGDGQVLYQSPVLRETDGAVPIVVDVSGAHLLSLIVDDAGDGHFDDLCTRGSVRLEAPP
jgi:hypothetical protein